MLLLASELKELALLAGEVRVIKVCQGGVVNGFTSYFCEVVDPFA